MVWKKLPVLSVIFAAIIALHWTIRADAQNFHFTNGENKTLTLPTGVFIVDATNGASQMSSQRTVASMKEHYRRVNRVWSQAGIEIEPVIVKRISVPPDLIQGLIRKRGRGGVANFFRAIRRGEIDMGRNNNAVIWNFFVRSLGGPNGLQSQGVNSTFVVDNPRNAGFRVTSHEIGHILGLYHARHNPNKLLFSGSNGLRLSEEEIGVARYFAKQLIR